MACTPRCSCPACMTGWNPPAWLTLATSPHPARCVPPPPPTRTRSTTSPTQPGSPHEHHQRPTRRNLTQNRGSAAPSLLAAFVAALVLARAFERLGLKRDSAYALVM